MAFVAAAAAVFLYPHFSVSKSRHPSFPIRCHSSSVHTGTISSSPAPPPMYSSFNLRAYGTSIISQIEAGLDAAIPVAHPDQIYEAMRSSVLSDRAKRVSAIMCIATCELVGGDRSAALPTACALEMIHAASRIHDFLPCMDADGLRSAHTSNRADRLALLAGDALLPLAFQHIVDRTTDSLVPQKAVLRVITQIARTVGSAGMATGQMLSILSSRGREQTDVMTVLEMKFGGMAECSAACGGLLGGASEEEVEALRKYGRAVGVLYEMVDEIFAEEKSGVGSNVSSGKMRSHSSLVRAALGMKRAMEIVEELKMNAYEEINGFGDKYGDRVLPLRRFVDYASKRGFVVGSRGKMTAAAGDSYNSDFS